MNNEKEEQRYGRNKSTLVDKSYISGGEYRRKFDKITDDNELSRLLYYKAKEMLLHRSGTDLEDMCWIDIAKKAIIASATEEKQSDKIVYSSTILRVVNESADRDILTMHTHPHSMPPSIEDFNASCYYNYKVGLVLCHNGTIYKYSSNELVRRELYERKINRNLLDGYSIEQAQINTLNYLMTNHDISFEEVK